MIWHFFFSAKRQQLSILQKSKREKGDSEILMGVLLLFLLLGTFCACQAAETSYSGSIFESGGQAIRKSNLAVEFTFLWVISLALVAEWVTKWLKKRINDSFQRIIASVLNEIMILGIISIIFFVLEDSNAWVHLYIQGDKYDYHVAHFIHMAIFIVAVLYIASIIMLIILMRKTASTWNSYEIAFQGPTMDDRSRNDIHRGSESDIFSPAQHTLLMDMDSKLHEYNLWREKATWFEKVINFRRYLAGIELKRMVQFRHVRSFFVR
jgi:hypothetical protein